MVNYTTLQHSYYSSSAVTHLTVGGSFKSSILYRSFLNLIVKEIMKIGPLLLNLS